MIVENLVCWRCAAALVDVMQPLARAAECPACTVDLHVCKLCNFFEPGARRTCNEPIADEVTDKERSNFCGYFQPRVLLAAAASEAEDKATAELESLFGLGAGSSTGSLTSGDAARSELDTLFALQPSSDDTQP